MIRPVLVFALVAGCAASAWPCDTVWALPSADNLIRNAEVIARVRAEGLSSTPGLAGIPETESRTQVRFAVLELLKGRLPTATIEFNGSLADGDDRNDRPVPYGFVRPGGRHGNCFALGYRVGAKYLLLLQRSSAHANALTPYWSALSPTNEQLFGGASDPWFVWVSQELRRR